MLCTAAQATWGCGCLSAQHGVLRASPGAGPVSSSQLLHLPPGDLRLTLEHTPPLSPLSHAPSFVETARSSSLLGSFHDYSELHPSIPLSPGTIYPLPILMMIYLWAAFKDEIILGQVP